MKLKLSFFIGSILIAVVILVVSLASSIRGGSVSPREYLDAGLLFHSKIIPGHLLYPLFVFRDKYQLFQASQQDQFSLRLHFAQMRLMYALELLNVGVPELSTSTIKKSQHYAFSSQNYVLNDDQQNQLIEFLDEFQDFLNEYKEQYPDEQKAILDNIFSENHYLLIKLQEQSQ